MFILYKIYLKQVAASNIKAFYILRAIMNKYQL